MSFLKTLTDAQSEALAVAASVGFVGAGSDIRPRDRVSKKRQSARVQHVTRATIEALVRYRFLVPHPERGAPYYVLTPSGYEEHDAGSKGTHGTFSFLFDVDSRDVKLCDEHYKYMWFDGWASELAATHRLPPNVVRYLTKIRHEYGRRP